jgi:Family of unknown function (DUF5681)
MASRKGSDFGEYAVGYGRPPKETRFAPGRSGNPRGRPKAVPTVGAILRSIIQQKIAVTENGKTRRLPALEVLLRRLVNNAMRGDAKALKLMVSFLDRYAETTEAKVQLNDLLAEDREILTQYLPEATEPVGTAAEKADGEPTEPAETPAEQSDGGGGRGHAD